MGDTEVPSVIRTRKRDQASGAAHDDRVGGLNDQARTTGVFVFENPTNGHREEVSGFVWLWALLFGWIYLLVKGLVIHVLVWLVIAFLGFLWLGSGGLFVAAILNIFYAAKVQSLLRANYLRKGWVEVEYGRASDGSMSRPAEANQEQSSAADELRKLAGLRADGSITDEEYQRLKERLIE